MERQNQPPVKAADFETFPLEGLNANLDESFEESEVFKVKIEKNEESCSGIAEPILDRVIKLEFEPIRKTRQRTLFTTRQLPQPGEVILLPVNTQVNAPEVVDLEENPQSGIQESTNCRENEAKGTNKRSAEVVEDQPVKILRVSSPIPMKNIKIEPKSSLEEKWVCRVNSCLESRNWTKLHNHFMKMPSNLSPKSFHELIASLKNANQLGLSSGIEPVLLQAIAKGIEVKDETLDIFSQVNFNDEKGRNILFLAIKHHHGIPMLRILIKKGANPRQVDIRGHNLLHWAVAHGSTPDVIQFLSREVDINEKDFGEGETPVFKLKYVRDSAIKMSLFKQIVNSGADIYQRNLNGETPLHVFLQGGFNSGEVQKLLKFLGEINSLSLFNIEDNQKKTPLRILNSEGETVLYCALNRREELSQEVLTTLFISSVNANIFRLEKCDEPILQTVAKYGSLEALEKILEKVKDVNERAPDGMTAFLCACQSGSGQVEKAELLWRKGTEVKARSKNGMTALHHAAVLEVPKDMMQFLLEKVRLDLEATDNFGNTPLLTILTNFSYEMETQKEKVKYLLQEGANVNAKNEDGETPLHLALKAYKKPSETSLAFLKFLLENGSDVNAPGAHGWTSIHFAVNCGEVSLELLKFLDESGAKMNARTWQGQTIMHFAAKQASLKTIRFCLEKGLSVNSPTSDGTPLHLFLQQLGPAFKKGKLQPEEYIKTMKLLLGATRASSSTRNDLKEKVLIKLEKIGNSGRFTPLFGVYTKIYELLNVKVKIVSEKYRRFNMLNNS